MHTRFVRQRLREALTRTGTALAESATLIGRPLAKEDSRFLQQRVRGPYIDKPETIQAEGIAVITAKVLDVLRVIAAENPDALERAITITVDAEEAEREAPDVAEILPDLAVVAEGEGPTDQGRDDHGKAIA